MLLDSSILFGNKTGDDALCCIPRIEYGICRAVHQWMSIEYNSISHAYTIYAM